MLSYEFPPLGGGGASVVNGLTEELGRQDQHIDLVTMGALGHRRGQRHPWLTISRVPCYRKSASICQPWEMVPYLLLGLPYLLWKTSRTRYRVNHTHFLFPDGVMAWLLFRLTGLPYVVTAHGSDVPGYNPDRFKLLHRVLKPLWYAVTRNANCIICPSRHLESLIKRAYPDAPTRVIPNGIDTSRFSPGAVRDKSILVVSRMVERKGVQYLIESLEGWEGHPEVNVVGDGPYLDTLRSLARQKRVDVNFLGFVDNKSDRFKELLETSTYFVFTSSAENFPVVLLEAMSAGLAIVTTNDTGCAEAVGDAALTVPPKDSNAIRQALEQLISDPALANRLMKKARARVDEYYDAISIARQHLDIYREFGRRN
jgi:glycosyltransferase involved in cell wall biosynthesis